MEYEGTVYIGVVGPESELSECRDSIVGIERRDGDEGPTYIRATKGYEARQMHIDRFLKSDHDFIMMLDHDQVFPVDTLERLRAHKQPFVSGYYMRRTIKPLLPVWYEYGERGEWPMICWTQEPERGRLHKLGASGWGCVLIHRAVFEAVEPLLKGEQFVLEDDMDVWPYDLETVLKIMSVIEKHAEDPDLVRVAVKAFRSEFRPLRCLKSVIGSDIRFSFFAREAGFDLYGDPDVRCGHMINYPLSPDDFSLHSDDEKLRLRDKVIEQWQVEHDQIKQLTGVMR
jgi:hypothetical protein